MSAKISLDSFDKKILDCLQDNSDMALAEIARRVGLSTTPCWRRINRLQEEGIIRARVALLNRKAVNAGVTVFVAVRTAPHTAPWLARFAKQGRKFDGIVQGRSIEENMAISSRRHFSPFGIIQPKKEADLIATLWRNACA